MHGNQEVNIISRDNINSLARVYQKSMEVFCKTIKKKIDKIFFYVKLDISNLFCLI